MLYHFDADIIKDFALDNQLRIRRVKKSEMKGWEFGGPLSFVVECVSRNSHDGKKTIKKLAASLLLFKRSYPGLKNELPWFRLRWGRGQVSFPP